MKINVSLAKVDTCRPQSRNPKTVISLCENESPADYGLILATFCKMAIHIILAEFHIEIGHISFLN